jgi:hypothetical protein
LKHQVRCHVAEPTLADTIPVTKSTVKTAQFTDTPPRV